MLPKESQPMPAELATITNLVPACPCACCSTTEGLRNKRRGKIDKKPIRYSGARYGYDGMLCKQCKRRFEWRDKQQTKVRSSDRNLNQINYLPTPEQIAENARAVRADWVGGEKYKNDGREAKRTEKDEARKREYARRAERERKDARLTRQMMMRASVAMFYAGV